MRNSESAGGEWLWAPRGQQEVSGKLGEGKAAVTNYFTHSLVSVYCFLIPTVEYYNRFTLLFTWSVFIESLLHAWHHPSFPEKDEGSTQKDGENK